LEREELKKQAGEKAVEHIEDGMIIGLGTGSTVEYTLKKLVLKELNTKKKKFSISDTERTANLSKVGSGPTCWACSASWVSPHQWLDRNLHRAGQNPGTNYHSYTHRVDATPQS